MVCGILLLAHDKSERVLIHQATVFEERVVVIAHDCNTERGAGLGAGASKASQKKRRNEEGPACASHPVDKMLPSTATCRLLYCIVWRCAAYMAPWH